MLDSCSTSIKTKIERNMIQAYTELMEWNDLKPNKRRQKYK